MEGYLHKKEGFFAGWVQYYFILHEDMLVYLDKKGGRPLGSIHMKIAKISPDQKDRLLIQIFNGTNQILLRATSIKDMVQWTNSLVNCQKQCLEGRYDFYKQKSAKSNSPTKHSSDNNIFSAQEQPTLERPQVVEQDRPNYHEILNMKFCSKVFTPDSPFFTKLSLIWELEAQLQELISLIVPEALRTKNPLIKDYSEKISNVIEQMKEQMTDCFTDIEDTRREMYRVAKQMIKIKDGIINKKQPTTLQTPQYASNVKGGLTQAGGISPRKQDSAKHLRQSTVSPSKNAINQIPMTNYAQSFQTSSASSSQNNARNVVGKENLIQTEIQKINNNTVNDQIMNQSDQRKQQQQNRTAGNSHLFDEEQSKPKVQQSLIVPRGLPQSPNAIEGYGGIPITYTMKMREGLPSLIPENQSYSIWSILKSSMGKDLSRITMPIWLNEPVSMLQKISEVTHYQDIMDIAVTIKDDYKKMGYIGIFLAAQYSDVYQRTRKPFNPILGETYEIIQPKFRFMAEQVSHHPPISAFYLEGKGYYTHGDTDVKNFFWGSSLEFRAVGLQHLYLTDSNDHLVIKRPDNSANNLIVGKLYIDVHGKMEINNLTKGIKCIINIHRIGWTKKNYYKVEGQIMDQDGKCRFEINGKWNEFLSLKDCSTGIEEVIFKAEPKPELTERMYGFGRYACNLNYIDDEMKKTLPPTDCRRRLDQKLMEEGKYDQAAEEKRRLEEKQRAVRKLREEMGVEHKPRYFVQVKDEYSGEKMYQFNHTYWEKRKNLDFGDMPDLF